MTRPDMYRISGYEGRALDLDKLQYLPEDMLLKTKKQIKVMTDAALADYQHIIVSDKLDLRVLGAVDEYFNRQRVGELIKNSDPKDFSNDYLISVCEFGVTLGELFEEIEGFGWLYSDPYFHSIIVHKNTGLGITVFDWAVKKFSGYGVDDGFVAKFNMALDELNRLGS